MTGSATGFDVAAANERAKTYLRRHESYRPFDEDVLMARALHYFCLEMEVKPSDDRQKQTTAEIAEARERARSILDDGIIMRGMLDSKPDEEGFMLAKLLLEACDVMDASPRPAA